MVTPALDQQLQPGQLPDVAHVRMAHERSSRELDELASLFMDGWNVPRGSRLKIL